MVNKTLTKSRSSSFNEPSPLRSSSSAGSRGILSRLKRLKSKDDLEFQCCGGQRRPSFDDDDEFVFSTPPYSPVDASLPPLAPRINGSEEDDDLPPLYSSPSSSSVSTLARISESNDDAARRAKEQREAIEAIGAYLANNGSLRHRQTSSPGTKFELENSRPLPPVPTERRVRTTSLQACSCVPPDYRSQPPSPALPSYVSDEREDRRYNFF